MTYKQAYRINRDQNAEQTKIGRQTKSEDVEISDLHKKTRANTQIALTKVPGKKLKQPQ